ncbi:MAG TPA: hypothetical protein DCE42_29580 [Myxococcales bacterium]|nr:hypothetical protein [Deltaproteobacteria bacterium]MBU54374.1 hypothetical protein [Deltaproteobacteria bacterium]HAA58945.1 hypothetical protein [Myxococcales bacterium]
MTNRNVPRKVILVIGILILALLGTMPLTGCRSYIYRRSSRKIVKTYYRPNGCWVRRVVYPCYSRRGNLKIQRVRCPDGRRWKRKWIHPDNRCRMDRRADYIP